MSTPEAIKYMKSLGMTDKDINTDIPGYGISAENTTGNQQATVQGTPVLTGGVQQNDWRYDKARHGWTAPDWFDNIANAPNNLPELPIIGNPFNDEMTPVNFVPGATFGTKAYSALEPLSEAYLTPVISGAWSIAKKLAGKYGSTLNNASENIGNIILNKLEGNPGVKQPGQKLNPMLSRAELNSQNIPVNNISVNNYPNLSGLSDRLKAPPVPQKPQSVVTANPQPVNEIVPYLKQNQLSPYNKPGTPSVIPPEYKPESTGFTMGDSYYNEVTLSPKDYNIEPSPQVPKQLTGNDPFINYLSAQARMAQRAGVNPSNENNFSKFAMKNLNPTILSHFGLSKKQLDVLIRNYSRSL